MPDIGMPPPPPSDVAAQMQPSVPPGGQDIGSMIGQFATQQMGPLVDIGMKVIEVEPLLNQMARRIPTLAPAVDQLLGEMKSRMGAPGLGMAGLAGMPPAPMPGGPPPPMGGAVPPPMGGPSASPVGAAPPPGMPPDLAGQGLPPEGAGPGGPIALPPLPPEMGILDLSMLLEVKLPGIGADDPTLLPNVQFFIAKMREEVPKVISGDQETQAAALQSNNPAPTEGSNRQIPSVA